LLARSTRKLGKKQQCDYSDAIVQMEHQERFIEMALEDERELMEPQEDSWVEPTSITVLL
jgi:hypothetical protein